MPPRRLSDLLFRIRGEDDLSAPAGKGEAALKDLREEADRAGKDLRDLGDSAEETTQAFDDGAGGGLAGGVGGVAGALGGAAIVGAFGTFATSVSDQAVELIRFSEQTGISVEALAALSAQGEQVGVDFEGLAGASQTLSEKLLDAENGSVGVIEEFENLGLTWEDLKNLTPEEQLDVVGAALLAIESDSERAAAGGILLGDEWLNLVQILEAGGGTVQAVIDKQHELGTILGSDGVETLADLSEAWTILQQQVETALSEALIQVAPTITELLPVMSDLISGLGSVASAAVSAKEAVGGFLDGIHGGQIELDDDEFLTRLGDLVGFDPEQVALAGREERARRARGDLNRAHTPVPLPPSVPVPAGRRVTVPGGDPTQAQQAAENVIPLETGYEVRPLTIGGPHQEGPLTTVIVQVDGQTVADTQDGLRARYGDEASTNYNSYRG